MKETINCSWMTGPGQGTRLYGGLKQTVFGALLALVMSGGVPAFGQGMPSEARENIHMLFNGHEKLERKLKLTDQGYEAVTQSDDEQITAALQKHVQQMQERLDRGLAARRWDPAFAEYRAYYDEIEFKVETTERGVKVVAQGKTPEAAKVAQNHARVINEFVNDGWDAHDRSHPAVLASANGVMSTERPHRMGGPGQEQARGRWGKGCPRGCGRGCSVATNINPQPQGE